MKNKIIGLVSLMVLFSLVLVGCGNNKSNSANGGGDKGGENILYTFDSSNPGSLDPALAQGTHESYVLNHLYTGLLDTDKDGNIVAGMADLPEVSEDGLTYKFTIKDGMKWSNGDPVTAKDFEYEWLRVLNPETASYYAYQLYYVKGGKDYNTVEKPGVYYMKDNEGNDTAEIDHEVKYTDADLQGLDTNGKSDDEIADMVYQKWLTEKRENVGVKALDDKTLEVTLENPTPYFADLCSFYTLFPVNSKVVEENPDWAKTGEGYVCNGPFVLKNWEQDSKIELVKNDNWYRADEVKLDGITFDILEDTNTAYQNYDSGKYPIMVDPPQEVVAQKSENKADDLVIGKMVGTYYYSLNVIPAKDGAKNPFTNVNIRKALSMALDRDTIVNKITKGGQIAANAFVPYGLKDENGNDFREENGTLLEYNPEEAKKLLDKGLQEEGLTIDDLNGQVLLYNTAESHKKIAQAVQQMWKEKLGFEVGLENVDFNVKLSRERAHDFEISRGGWVGDYADPMTMLDLFVTGSSMNNPGYNNPKYDELIEEAKSTADQNVRMPAMKEAEKILMEDMPIIPVYYYTQPYLVKPNVKGIYKPVLKYPILTFAEIGQE